MPTRSIRAFDLVDHDILLQRLETRFCYRSDPLKWVRSYLSGRTQVVTVDRVFSHRDTLTCNVPQGSVLGADFYSDFTAPVEETVKDVVSNHYYADDSQLYNHFTPGNKESEETAVRKMEEAISRVKSWMNANLLKLNGDKTEIMIIGSRQQLLKVNIPFVKVGDYNIEPSSSAKNIAAVFDSTLSFVAHIDNVCKLAWLSLQHKNNQKISGQQGYKDTYSCFCNCKN